MVVSTRYEIFQTELAEGFYAILEGNTSARLAPHKLLPHKDEAKLEAINKMDLTVSITVVSQPMRIFKMDQNASTINEAQQNYNSDQRKWGLLDLVQRAGHQGVEP